MADFGEDIAVSLVPDFTRFDQEYRAEVERLQHNPVSIPITFQIDKAKLKADLEAAAKELGRSTEIRVQVKLDTTAARAELARLRADASMSVRGGGGAGGGFGGGGGLLFPAGVAAAAFAPGIVGAGLGAGAALGTGILGYQGLKAQASTGTGFGADINNEINKIKAAFAGLGQTAANALGPGVSSALGKIRQALPGLAPEVDKLGSSLGTVADQLGTGLVNVLQSSGPLVDAFGDGIAKLAKDFARFTGSDQFKHFIADSAKQLPHLVNGLEGAARVLGDVYQIVRPLAPLLATTAGAMADLADALAKLPDPAKLALVAALVGASLRGGGGRGGGGLLGGRGTLGLLGLGLGVSSFESDNPAVNIFGTAAGGAAAGGAVAGPYGAAFGGALGLGAGLGKTIYEQFFQQTVSGQGRIAPSLLRSMQPQYPVFPDYQLGQAGIDPTAGLGKSLRDALTATLPSQAAVVPGLDALDQRYGPAIQAMDSYRQAQQQVQAAVQSENQVEVQGAAQVSAAQDALAQAREQATRTAIADAQQVENAQRAVSDARRNAARVAEQSANAIAGAEQQITDAQEAAQTAQENLLQARKDAARQLVDMARAAVDTGDSLQAAQLHLQQLQLEQAARLGTKTPEEIYREQNQLINRGNTLALKTAQDQVTDSQITHTRAVHDNNQAQKKGVEGSPGVVAAKKAVKDANDAVAKSEQNLADVRHQAAENERTANRQVADSVRALAAVRVQAAQDRADAEDQVAAAVKGVQTAEQNAKQADDDAHQRTLDIKKAANDAGDAFAYQAAKVGLTTKQVKELSTAIDQGKFDLVATFKDKNAQQVMQDTINVQRELYEAVLIAGGATPGEARRQAAGRLPYPRRPPDPGTPTNTGDRPLPPPNTSRTPGIPQATGGPIFGPGGPTDDLAGVFALSAGEHVWTAKEVQNAGGHKAVEDMRAYYRGMAEGGEVPTEADGPTIDFRKMRLVGRLRAYASGLIGAGGPAGGPGGGGAGEGAVWEALRAAGFSAVVAAGIMGNIQSETGNSWSPFIIQGGARSRDPRDAGGGGYGLVQWTPGSKLIPYLNGQAASIASEVAALAAQLRGEGPSPESAAGRALRGASSPSDAAVLFGTMYERYGGAIQGQRSIQAEQIYAYYGGAGRPGGGMAGDGKWTPTGGFNVMPGTYTPPWPRPIYHKLSSNTARAASFVRHHFGLDSYPDQTRVDQFDHPWGKATDNMIPNYGSTSGINKGWSVANWFADNPHVFGTKYILWRSSQSDGSGWSGPGVEGHYNHVHTSFYDEGGVLPPGTNVVVNSSNKPEAVLTNAQWRVLKSLGSGRRGPVMHVENQIIQSPAEADALVRMLQFAALAAGGGGL
jgi:hypothetical protein